MKKNNKNLYLIILCIVALIFLILTVFLHVNKRQNTLRVAINKPITTLDISKAVNHNDLTVLLNTEEGLYRLNKDNIPQKALAKKVRVYDNGTKWIITLKKAYWNNGQRITANDFVYSWRRTNTLPNAPYAYLFKNIKNATSVQDGHLSTDKLGIHALNREKIELLLNKPQNNLKQLLCFPTFFPQKKSIVDRNQHDYGLSASKQLYSGPFLVKKWKGLNSVFLLQKNKDYWDASNVHLKYIKYIVSPDSRKSMSLFDNNKLDIMSLKGAQNIEYKDDKDYKNYAGYDLGYLQVNLYSKKINNNMDLVNGLATSINKKKLADFIMHGQYKSANRIIPNKLQKNNGPKFIYNFNVAKQDIQKANIQKTKLKLLFTSDYFNENEARFIQYELNRLPNVSVELKEESLPNYLTDLHNGNYDLALKQKIPTFFDSNALLNKSINTYQIPLFWFAKYDGGPSLQKNRVKGLIYHPIGINWDYKNVRLNN